MEPKRQRRSAENGDFPYLDTSFKRMSHVATDSSKGTTVYLDYNATTPLETSVLDAIYTTLKYAWGNPSSSYAEGKMAKRVIHESRVHVSKMINCSASEIIFTSGGTESNNVVFHSVIDQFNAGLSSMSNNKKHLKSCLPHIITTNIEHDSVILALKSLCNKEKTELTILPVSKETGKVNVDDITSALKWNTVLVSVMLANNETGIVQPINEITKAVHLVNQSRTKETLPPVFVHTDAAQAIGKIAVDCQELDVDYLTIVGHKFYGPRIGALFARNLGANEGAPLSSMFYGGGQERNYRPGTENTGMIAGLGEACRLVTENIQCYGRNMENIRDYLESRLEYEFSGKVNFNSRFMNSKRLPNTCNVSILGPKFRGRKILATAKCLQASVGAACHSDRGDKPSHILTSCGIPEDVAKNAIRLSVGRYTTIDDIDRVVEDLKRVVHELDKAT